MWPVAVGLTYLQWLSALFACSLALFPPPFPPPPHHLSSRARCPAVSLSLQEVFLMSKVATPMGTYPRCLLRGSDVIALDFA